MLTNIKMRKSTVGWGFCIGLLVAALVVEVRADAIDQGRVTDLLKELRADEFAVRERAQLALDRMGPSITPILRKARAKADDAELRLRLDNILIGFLRRPVTKGQRPLLSPDGASLAFVREFVDPNRVDFHGNNVSRNDVWIRDLRKATERLLVRNAIPTTWTDDSHLATRYGILLDVKTGVETKGAAKLPDEMHVRNVVLSPGGKRLVYIPNIMFYSINPSLKAPGGTNPSLYVVDASGRGKEYALGHSIDTDNAGFLHWSPDGKSLAFHLLFFRDGNVPIHRIGVLDVGTGKTRFLAEGAYVHQNWGLLSTERMRCAPNPWDRESKQFVFVTGRGDGEAQIYMANASEGRVSQLTKGQLCKWSPTLSPSGRRLAYCTAKYGEESGSLEDVRVMMLDLYSGESQTIALPRKKDCACYTLAWSADGQSLFYDVTGSGGDSQIYQARFERPKSIAEGSRVRWKPRSTLLARVKAALESPQSTLANWGAEKAYELRHPSTEPALRKALRKWLPRDTGYTVQNLLYALWALDAVEAVPEVIKALDSRSGWLAARMLAHWQIKEAIGPLRAIVQSKGKNGNKADAAAALVNLGEEEGWKFLTDIAGSKKGGIRSDAAYVLRLVRDPRSVELLIGLVEDKHSTGITWVGEQQVGDHAEYSLATITGQTFARDKSRWQKWWKAQAGKMPRQTGENKGLIELERRIQERGEKRQKEMRAKR